MPLFSIIIPLYNKAPFVHRAINSALNQTCQDFEIIVVDGGSTDEGPNIVKGHKDSRILFFPQKGTGVSNARNQGVEISKAELIAFLDADDEWMPHHLETLLRLRERFPCAGAYTTAYKIQEIEGNLRWANYKEIPPAPWEGLISSYFKSSSLGEYPLWTSVVCIPKNIFFEMKGFPEDSWYGEDADLFGKIAVKYPVAFSWYMGGIYHWEATNRACSKKIPLEKEAFVKTAETLLRNNLVPQDKVEDLKEYVAKKEIQRAARFLDVGDTVFAKKILISQRTRHHRNSRMVLILRTTFSNPFLNYLLQKICTLKKRLMNQRL